MKFEVRIRISGPKKATVKHRKESKAAVKRRQRVYLLAHAHMTKTYRARARNDRGRKTATCPIDHFGVPYVCDLKRRMPRQAMPRACSPRDGCLMSGVGGFLAHAIIRAEYMQVNAQVYIVIGTMSS